MDRNRSWLVPLVVASILFAACTVTPSGGTASPSVTAEPATSGPTETGAEASPTEAAGEPATVRLQLQWVPQAQFAGYFAAENQGYFEEENLTVQILPGGPDVIPQQVGSAPDGPEFTISWVPKVLEAREAGSDLVDIAQIFQRSGTLSVAWADSGITDPCNFAGKKVGVWDFGNEFEVTAAALINCGFSPGLETGGDPATSYQKVTQPFDMTLLLTRQIDVAEAMIYNEYAQVLEATNPDTGELYQPEDLTVIDYNQQRTAMLQDAIFARQAWLEEEGNEEIAVRFLRASFKGWIYCRENPEDCVQYTIEAGSQLGAGHQAWMLNEVNALIWPSPLGLGAIDPIFWSQTVKVSKQAKIIPDDPDVGAYRTDLAEQALEGISDDTVAQGYEKGTVEVTPGGN
jgi:NitT/TauT family transport system substrate-binding protein